MQRRTSYILLLGGVLVVVAGLFIAFNLTRSQPAFGSDTANVQSVAVQSIDMQSAELPAIESSAAQAVNDIDQTGRQWILQYAAKFVCTEPIQPGAYWYGLSAPLVYQKTEVLIHNPWPYRVRLFKKAVLAPVERYQEVAQGQAPGKWREVTLEGDYAFRIDCDDVAKLLTGKADATFLGEYGIGKTVEGFVVIAIGPQPIDGANFARYGSLDVTADYVRGSEVLKKDINYQPWWTYWSVSGLPWRLGYPYERVVDIDPTQNIDCVQYLRDALIQDVEGMSGTPSQKETTRQGLLAGAELIAKGPRQLSEDSKAALVPLIGRCQKITPQVMEIDYALVSNVSPTPGYPWIPGRWYDLAVVVPQNIDVDIYDFFYQWQLKRWLAAGGNEQAVTTALAYYFPYWCGWGYWWWWWNAGDCIDIGVGEGESIDVEQITPSRIFVPQWPPTLN